MKYIFGDLTLVLGFKFSFFLFKKVRLLIRETNLIRAFIVIFQQQTTLNKKVNAV